MLGSDPIPFTVDAMHDFEKPLVLTSRNENVMGKIRIDKKEDETGEPLAGAKFDIIAAEDIVTGDGTVRAVKDEIVDTVTSGPDGKAESKELYLGKYIIRETQPAPGFSLKQEDIAVELVYEDQNTPVVYADMEVTNAPTTMTLTKTIKGKEGSLAGVKFQIWNAGMESDIDPDFALKETYETGENGQIELKYMQPGTYKIQEKETLPGYVLDETVYEFTVDKNGWIDGQAAGSMEIENVIPKCRYQTGRNNRKRTAGRRVGIDREGNRQGI